MSEDFDTRVQQRLARLAAAVPMPETTEVPRLGRPRVRPGLSGPSAGLAVLAAAVLLAVIVGLRLPSAPAASTGPSPAGGSAPPATPQATVGQSPASASPVAWTAVGPPLGRCVVTAAIWRRFGDILAICQGPGLGPEVLVSVDGHSWVVNEPTGIAPTGPGDVLILNALAENAAGDLLLVGAEASGDISAGDAAAWTSSDALHWHRVGPSPAFHDAEILGVLATSDGYLAVGDDGFPGASVQLPSLRGGAIWRASVDGRDWTRLPAPPAASQRELQGVVAGGHGYVAWGDGAPPGSGSIWTSPDGRSWSTASPPPGGAWGPINEVVATPTGYLATGSWTPGTTVGNDATFATIWTSPDGQGWSSQSASATTPGADVWSVVPLGDHLLGVGLDGGVGLSADGGASWTSFAADPVLSGAFVTHLVAVQANVVAFGSVSTSQGDEGRIWFGQIDAGSSIPPPCTAAALQVKGGRMPGGTGTANAFLYFTNIGSTPCSLSGQPKSVAFLTTDGSALPITPEGPPPDALKPATLAPEVRDAAGVEYNWSNWCGPTPGPLRVRVELAQGGSIVGPFDEPPEGAYVPRCDSPSQPSTLTMLVGSANPTP